jgi:LCP family protein required for cell wall assembly
MENFHSTRMRTRRQKPVRKRVFFALIVACILIFGVLLYKGAGTLSIFISNLIARIQLSHEKPINILLLGVGGGTHDGPDLTDTIIFAHIDPVNKKVTLVSLPRDLWIPSLDAKVNAIYTVASEKQQGNGLSTTEKAIGSILGQKINYGVKLDFSGFVKAVNIVGGLDINVDRTFDDYQYPIDGSEDATCGMSPSAVASASAAVANGTVQEQDVFPCRFKHIHFNQGEQHMDGETALEYVRSRHAVGPEGSDFARSKRQEKVISALKAKVFSAGTLLNPIKITGLIGALQGSIETDIKQDQYGTFIGLAGQMKGAKIASAVIDDGDPTTGRYGLLLNPPIDANTDYQWVLVPRTGATNYSEIQEYVACQIKGENCTVGQYGIITPTPVPTKTVQ